MKLNTLFVAVLWTLASASGVVGQEVGEPAGPCPVDHPLLREFVENILVSDAKATDREALGLTAVASEPLRVLGDRREDYPV